jgi:type I restriction enzyme R subunit
MAANRFNKELELEDEDKADFKIKAKQFVKIYGQMAAIMPYEMMAWEKLFWILKFLVPKLIVKDKDADDLDKLLESVDLSTYGLERTKLNDSIGLDASASELDPQNANPRGAHGEKEEDILESIIRNFNEKWFQGWEATPDEQRTKFIQLSKHIQAHQDFQSKVADNGDRQNSDLALEKIIEDVMRKQRKNELDLYKLYAKDEGFYQAFFDTMKRMVSRDRI